MGAPVVDASGLAKRFAGVTALDGIELHIAAGASVAVFGPNGAGKTTLLRLLATLLRPTAGSLRLFGESLRDYGGMARQRIGFLSHQSFLYPDLTPTENLEFYARMYEVDDPAARVRQWLDDVGLVGWAHRPVRTLSRGLEQRCALARALLHEPDLLLLDEPFTGLDASAAAMLTETLRAAQRRGATLLMTTHDVARGCALCTHAVILAQGRVVWEGDLSRTPATEVARLYEAATQRADAPHALRQ